MFDKVKGLLFSMETVDDGKPEVEATPVKAGVAPVVTSVAPVMQSTPMMYSVGVNEEMINILNTAVAEANLEGFDYIEFKEAISGMKDIPMTEQQKFETVFNTAKCMGVTVDKLTASVDHYLTVISKQRDEFMVNVDNAVKQQVDVKNVEIVTSEKTITDALTEITRLNEVVIKTQQEVLLKKNEVAQNQQQIDMTRSAFEATYNVVAGRLNEDKTKLTTFLKK